MKDFLQIIDHHQFHAPKNQRVVTFFRSRATSRIVEH
jgi:hypothetical protein